MNIAELRAINQPAKIFKIFLEIPINLLRQFSGHWLPSVLLRLGSNMAHSNGSTGMDPPSLGDLGELPKFGAVWVLCKSREKKDEASSWSSRVLSPRDRFERWCRTSRGLHYEETSCRFGVLWKRIWIWRWRWEYFVEEPMESSLTDLRIGGSRK